MKNKTHPTALAANQKFNSGKLSVLFTVVNRSKADFYMDIIQAFHVNAQLAILAHGTASKETLALLGLDNTEKTVICSVVQQDAAPAIMDVLEQKFNTIKNGKGISYSVPMSAIIGVAAYAFLFDDRSK